MLIGVVLLLVAALHDVAFRAVPNPLAGTLCVCGLGLRVLEGDLGGGVLAGLIVFVVAAYCWRRGWMGGGDVKLLAAASLLVPPMHVPLTIAFVAMAGGVLALPYIVARRRLSVRSCVRPATLAARVLRVERWRLRRGGPLPYAVAIAAGVCFAILQGGA